MKDNETVHKNRFERDAGIAVIFSVSRQWPATLKRSVICANIMIIKIAQLIGIGILTHLISWMFWLFYPLVPPILYFCGGIIAGKLLPDRKLYGGFLVVCPGIIVLGSIIVGNLLKINEASGFNLDTVVLIMLIPTVVTALVGSVFGERIWHFIKSY